MATYLLNIKGKFYQSVIVGALGEVSLDQGWYLYVGSARRHLEARLWRHLRAEKRRRWHIDYLLTGEACEIKEIWVGEGVAECALAVGLMALPGVTIPKKKFGASDCRCPAHFYRYDGESESLQQYLLDLGFSLYSPSQK